MRATGAQLVIVHPIPEAGWNVPELAAKKVFYEADPHPTITTDRRAYDRNDGEANALLDTIRGPGVFHVRPAAIFCDASRCRNAVDGALYYYDTHHLSLTGPRLGTDAVIDARQETTAAGEAPAP